jgi:hypothetical protein
MEDLSSNDGGKDLSFIDRLEYNNGGGAGPIMNIERLPPAPYNEPIFYEEKMEDDSYDYELIEEMFHSKKKIKISKDKS